MRRAVAVEAAQANFGHLPQVLVCQADIGRLPFRPGTFDFILSEGVLHHTPSTRAALLTLAGHLRPGGMIAFYVYAKKAPVREFTDGVRVACRAQQ